MKQTATLYVRARGATEACSVEHQLAVCRQAADRIGARVVAEYVEQESRRRPVLDDMIRRLTGTERTDLLVVASADRLTRRAELWQRLSKRLKKAGVLLAVAEDVNAGGSVAMLEFRYGLLDLMGRYEEAAARATRARFYRKRAKENS